MSIADRMTRPAWNLAGALLALALFRPGVAGAATAEDYFHGSSNKYVSGRLQEASLEAEEGLRRYPEDPRLNTLAELLRKLKDQQKQDQSGKGQSGDKDQDKKQDSNGGKNSGDEGEKEKQKQDPEKDKDQNGQDPKPSPEKDEGDRKDSSGQAQAPVKPGQMSKEDAERLLNSYQDDEKKEHERHGKPRRKIAVEEDW